MQGRTLYIESGLFFKILGIADSTLLSGVKPKGICAERMIRDFIDNLKNAYIKA